MGRRKVIEDDELLRHAREVFLSKGAFGSTKEIARRAGVSEAAVFHRYPTKTTLFLAAMMPPELDVGAIFNPARDLPDTRRALAVIGGGMLDYFRSLVPVVLHLMTNPAIRLQDIVTSFRSAPAPALVQALAEYLRESHRKGRVRVVDAQASAAILVAAIHSLALFELLGAHGGKFPRKTVRNFVDALWIGLAPTREGNP